MRRYGPRRTALAALLLICGLLLPSPGTPARRGRNLGDFPEQYRQILSDYSQGDLEQAVAELVAAETALFERQGEQIIDRMWRAKLAVIRELMSTASEVLVPITVLHEGAYIEYLDLGASSLAIHTRTMVIELAEYYAGKAADQRRKAVASDLLTSLAAHLQSSFMESTAAQLYERALRVYPDNVAALLGLAGIRERYGDYEDALGHLESLVLLDPENHEGHLRLGVILTRLERYDEARGVFDRLLASEPPEWILSVTYQEAARNLARQGVTMAAWDLLEEGVERLPGDTTLRIQLAYYSDRATSGIGGYRLDEALREREPAAAISPRYRYSEAPKTAIAEVRDELRRESSERLPHLARALVTSRNARSSL